ncbi:hypothetical protein Droror1_Dr00019799 [Drosera rotundifolia]
MMNLTVKTLKGSHFEIRVQHCFSLFFSHFSPSDTECMKSSDGQIPESSPAWCHASFDPVGLLGSLTAIVTCIFGLHFGHVLVRLQDHNDRLFHWSLFSSSSLIMGLFLALVGMTLLYPRNIKSLFL